MQHPPPSIRRERLTDISSVLAERAARTPDTLSCCFLDSSGEERGRLTYRDLYARVRSYAGALAKRTLPGDRVILALADPADFIPLFMGCLQVSRIPVPISPPAKRQSLTRTHRVLADSEAALFVGDAESKEALASEAAVDRLPFVEARELQGEETDLRLRSDRLAFIQYTSGSTGSPKGAMITHDNIMANLAMIETAFQLNEQTRGCCWMPLYHDMGLIGHVLQAFYSGFPLFLLQPLALVQRPLVWLRTITRYRVSATGGPNFGFELCIRRIGPQAMAGLDLSSWTTAYTGAEMINPQTLSRFGEKFAPCGFRPDAFLPCYGIAEATLLASSAPWGRGAVTVARRDAAEGGGTARYISVGLPPADAQIIVRHTTSRLPCPRFEVGEVYIKGPHVMSGYWNNAAATQEALCLQDGTVELRTGDLGYLGEENHLIICGRLKEVLVLAGRKHIHGDLVMSVSASHEAIDAGGVAVFSITDKTEEDQAVLVCEIKRAFWSHLQEIRQVIVDSIRSAVQRDHGLLIRQVAFTRQNSLPRTTSGKLMVLETRRLFLERALGLE